MYAPDSLKNPVPCLYLSFAPSSSPLALKNSALFSVVPLICFLLVVKFNFIAWWFCFVTGISDFSFFEDTVQDK